MAVGPSQRAKVTATQKQVPGWREAAVSGTSLTGTGQIASSTVRELIGLFLQSASTTPEHAVSSSYVRLSQLLTDDPAFRQWWTTSKLPACSGELPIDLQEPAPEEPEDKAILNVCRRLPESMLPVLPALPCSNADRINLQAAAHNAIRLRSLETSWAEELQAADNRRLYNFAYGLSHELNNPLANISTRAGVLLQRNPTDEDAELLKSIVDAAMRGCEMLRDLMLIARPPKLEMEEIDLSAMIVRSASEFEPFATRRGIDLVCEAQPMVSILADRVALNEILWALVRNSLEACDSGQSVRIACRRCENAALLTIIDTGPGISEEARENCFDFYYSGREAGRGLGMGLAKSKRIVELHRGSIGVESDDAGGCRLTLRFPLAGL